MPSPDQAAAPAARSSAPLEKAIADEAHFIRRLIDNPARTGAVSPSGRFLARAMAAQVDPSLEGPVIELGPGTGPVTRALIRRGIPQSRLVLVEFDPGFCALLRRRFPGVRVIEGDAFSLGDTLAGQIGAPAAAVVSSLPLLNAPEWRRKALLDEAFDLMQPQGIFVQFTYGMLSPIRRTADALSFEASAAGPIWLNLPPARIWTYRRPGRADARGKRRRAAPLADIVDLPGRLSASLAETASRLGFGRRVGRAVAVRSSIGAGAKRREPPDVPVLFDWTER